MAQLGEILAELRIDANLTQKELGKILNVSSGTISNYEKGVHLPDAEKLVQIAHHFNVTTDYLLCATSVNVPLDFLQKPIARGRTAADIIHDIYSLPQEEQQALVTIISNLALGHMIKSYNERGNC